MPQQNPSPQQPIIYRPTDFHWPVRIYWEDTDAGGVVFYANYLKYFERARTEWLRSLGLEQHTLREQTGGVFVVSDVQLQYLRPARLDDVLHISAQVCEHSRVSLTLTQHAWRIPTSTDSPTSTKSAQCHVRGLEHESLHERPQLQLLCSARVRIAWIDAAQWKPARMPTALSQCIENALQHRTV